MPSQTVIALVDIAHFESALALLAYAKTHVAPENLHVAYVMPYGFYSYVEPYVSEEMQEAAASRAKSELARLIEQADLPMATPHVLRGGVGEQALQLSESLNAGQILINAVRSGSLHTTLGTHAAQIARHAKCTVTIVR